VIVGCSGKKQIENTVEYSFIRLVDIMIFCGGVKVLLGRSAVMKMMAIGKSSY